MRKYICNQVKPIWNHFHLYIMRHWCAIARLIQTKVETKKWDIWDVKERLGHEKVTTTEGYVRFAKRYFTNAPYDWIRAILKFHYHSDLDQENSRKSITMTQKCTQNAIRIGTFETGFRKLSSRMVPAGPLRRRKIAAHGIDSYSHLSSLPEDPHGHLPMQNNGYMALTEFEPPIKKDFSL